jgi:hypothetical protein
MRAARLGSALGATALMLLASASDAQQSGKRPPSIMVFSSNGIDVINTTSYITPEIRVGENAYVFAVMMDLDGQIRVLHPDFPGISVKLSAHKSVQLPNFFVGFNREPYTMYASARFQTYTTYNGYGDTRGTVLALASRKPFDLEKLEVGGDWDMIAIRHLIEDRTPQGAMLDLANYIGAEGEPIGRDFMRFAGGSNAYASEYYDAYGSYYTPCSYFFGYSAIAKARASRGNRVPGKIVGYDACGFPIFSYGAVTTGSTPQLGQPHSTGDTTHIPKSRFPQDNPRHRKPQSASLTAPQGVFPVVHRTDLPQMGDVTVMAPKGRKGDPGQVLEGYRTQGGGVSVPQGRIPIERTATGSQPTAATAGGQPQREYHPEPRVETPPPARAAPEHHDSPPPQRTQPSSPPPSSSPRAESSPSRSEPLRPVPQNRH